MSETIPLTHFEELMLHQDSSAYPVSCFVRLRFEGRLVRAAFESAACVAIGSHPLLHAVVEKQKRYVWRVGDVAPKITWTDGDHQPEPEMRQLDITAEYGLRFFVRLYENRSDVLIQLHHACCDGIAMSDPELLLDGIQREMNQIKRLELGHLFSFALRPQRLVPGALRRAARPGRCCVTAVFTNIGRVLACCPGALSIAVRRRTMAGRKRCVAGDRSRSTDCSKRLCVVWRDLVRRSIIVVTTLRRSRLVAVRCKNTIEHVRPESGNLSRRSNQRNTGIR